MSSWLSGCWTSWSLSMATTAGVWGWTLAGVWDRFGLPLVPGGVFLPVGVLEAAAGTRGDRGRLLGAAGDGGLFLGFGVLVRKRQVRQRADSTAGRKVPSPLQETQTRPNGRLGWHGSPAVGGEVEPSTASRGICQTWTCSWDNY